MVGLLLRPPRGRISTGGERLRYCFSEMQLCASLVFRLDRTSQRRIAARDREVTAGFRGSAPAKKLGNKKSALGPLVTP